MLHLRVTKEQLQALALRAAASKRSLSDWLRMKLEEIASEPLDGSTVGVVSMVGSEPSVAMATEVETTLVVDPPVPDPEKEGSPPTGGPITDAELKELFKDL